jgi:hypothetical protein
VCYTHTYWWLSNRNSFISYLQDEGEGEEEAESDTPVGKYRQVRSSMLAPHPMVVLIYCTVLLKTIHYFSIQITFIYRSHLTSFYQTAVQCRVALSHKQTKIDYIKPESYFC